MKVYHPKTGAAYEGHAVDCRELMQVAGYTKEPPGAAPAVTEATQAKADAAVRSAAAAVITDGKTDARVSGRSKKEG